MSDIHKPNLQERCREMLEAAAAAARNAMQEAQESANREEKSSMGDKYETGRAMSHQERDLHARQLHHLMGELSHLNRIDCSLKHDVAETGALVQTSMHVYWIAVALGSIETKAGKVIVISPASPVAQALRGKKAGEEFIFQGKIQRVVSVS